MYWLKSWTYMFAAIPSWRMLLTQDTCFPRLLAFERAGRSMAARMAMMAITTSNSMSVKPARELVDQLRDPWGFIEASALFIIAILAFVPSPWEAEGPVS